MFYLLQGPIHSSTEMKVDLGSSSKWNNKLAIQPSITMKPEPKIANRREFVRGYIYIESQSMKMISFCESRIYLF